MSAQGSKPSKRIAGLEHPDNPLTAASVFLSSTEASARFGPRCPTLGPPSDTHVLTGEDSSTGLDLERVELANDEPLEIGRHFDCNDFWHKLEKGCRNKRQRCAL